MQARWRLRVALLVVSVIVVGVVLVFFWRSSPKALLGAEAGAAVLESDDWEILSLYPYELSSQPQNGDPALKLDTLPTFGMNPILGRAKLTQQEVVTIREAFVDTLTPIVEDEHAKCYWPRHGLLIKHGGREYGIEICFPCGNGHVHSPNRKSISVTTDARETFDSILDAHKLMRSPR